jgi:hypothetical protein
LDSLLSIRSTTYPAYAAKRLGRPSPKLVQTLIGSSKLENEREAQGTQPSGTTGTIMKTYPCREKLGNLLKGNYQGQIREFYQRDQKVFCKGKYFSLKNSEMCVQIAPGHTK